MELLPSGSRGQKSPQEKTFAWIEVEGQVAQVFDGLWKESFAQDRWGSVLVEMPHFVVTDDHVKAIRGHMERLFPSGPSAVLFRDSVGCMLAHKYDGVEWSVIPLEDFLLRYSSSNEGKRPPVVCFYSQDSAGGDFGFLSRERNVRSHYTVYL